MSIRAMNWAYEQRTGSPVRKAVLVALADFADEGHSSWPSVMRLAEMCEVSESTVRRALRELEAAGLIHVDRTRMRETGGQTSNLYRLAVDGRQLTLLDASAQPRPTSDGDGQVRPVNLTPPGCHQRQGGAVNGDTPYEPPLDPSVEVNPLRVPINSLEGFDRFWETWPKSPRKVAKQACRDRWARNGLARIADTILAHVEVMKRSRQWRDGFEPSPLTYINQRRWDDGAPDEKSPTQQRPRTDAEWLALASTLGVESRGLTLPQLIAKIQIREARP